MCDTMGKGKQTWPHPKLTYAALLAALCVWDFIGHGKLPVRRTAGDHLKTAFWLLSDVNTNTLISGDSSGI